jgi:hypothetical protein
MVEAGSYAHAIVITVRFVVLALSALRAKAQKGAEV